MKSAQFRLILDANVALHGTAVEIITEKLQFAIDNMIGNGTVTGDTEAELNDWGVKISVRPEPLSEDDLAQFMQTRIEEGQLDPEDLPVRLARYGLMEPDAFIIEMRERMENMEGNDDDEESDEVGDEKFEMRRVEDLKPGNHIDLSSCPYLAGSPAAEEMYGVVVSIHQETPECTLVTYEDHAPVGYSVGTLLKLRLPHDVPDPVVRVHLIGQPETWSEWNISQNLTDRWGELNEHDCSKKPLQFLERDTTLFEGLQAQMWDELTFITRKDGQFGILYEAEFVSKESEMGSDNDSSIDLKPHAEMVKIILDGLAKIAPDFPEVEFCVPEEHHIINDRPAAWAFVKDGLLDKAGREKLGMALLSI